MIASLPMYALPRTAGAHARFWTLIRNGLAERSIPAPERLTRAIADLRAHWLSPDLVLSQTCGLPFRLWLANRVALVGTPDYAIQDCPPGHYRSVVIARADDPREVVQAFRGARLALNDPHSQSGWAALATEAPEVVTGPKRVTGSHRASVRAVRRGEADFAAIDAVTWRHLEAAEETAGLRIVHATSPTPGLPLITALTRDAVAIEAAVSEAIGQLAPADRDRLGLRALVRIPAEAYLALPTPPTPEKLLTT